MNNNDNNHSLNTQLPNNELTNYLKKYKYWFILPMIIFLLAAVTYQWLHQSIYNVSTIIQVNNVKNGQDRQLQFLSQTNNNGLQHFSKIIRSGVFKKKMGQQIQQPLLDDELNDLQITIGNKPNTLILSLNTTQPRQASLFLNNLYFVYTNENKKTASLQDFNIRLDSLSHFIAKQTKQANFLKSRSERFSGLKQTAEQILEAKKQLDILKTIKPYLLHADRQFQLIPTTFPVTDPYINNLILQFNNAQNDKQSLLSDNPSQPAIAAANQKITGIQNLLITAIDRISAKVSGTNSHGVASLNNKVITDSLTSITKIINDSISSYAEVLLKKRVYQNLGPTAKPYHNSLIINAAQVNGNIFGLYIIAILLGILLPLAIFYIFGPRFKNSTTNSSGNGADIPDLGDIKSPAAAAKLAEKITRLLAASASKIILLTSDAELNKDLISLEIAFHLAEKKLNLVIVDLDFETVPFSAYESAVTQPGVIDYITGKTTRLPEIVMPTPYPLISRIGKGNSPQGYSSLKADSFTPYSANEDIMDTVLNNAQLGVLVNRLAKEFDLVILNTSSLAYHANVLPLTKMSNIHLVILGSGATYQPFMNNLNKLVVKHCIKDIYIIKN